MIGLAILMLAAAPATGETIDQAGIRLDARAARAGTAVDAPVLVDLRLTDIASNMPLANLHPLAWLTRMDDARPEQECRRRIARLVDGGLLSPAQVDFNSYRLLVVNTDDSLTIVNPQVSLAGTQLEGVVALPGVARDVAVDAQGNRAFVALGDRVLSVDLAHGSATDFGGAIAATTLRWDGIGGRLWTAGPHGVVVLDGGSGAVLRRFDGSDAAGLELTPSRNLVAFAGGNGVVAADATGFATVAIAGVAGARALSYGDAARRFYAIDRDGAVIALPDGARMARTIPGVSGAERIAFEPQGRFALVLGKQGTHLWLVDSAADRVVAETDLAARGLELRFSDRYGYVRSADGMLTLLALEELRVGQLAAVTVPLATGGPRAAPSTPATDGIGLVAVPEGSGVLALSGDGGIAFYAEGMMVAMGALPTYGRQPRSLYLLDRGLRETAPGRYRASAALSAGGPFTLAVALDEPRIAACIPVMLPGAPPAGPSNPVTIAMIGSDAGWRAGDSRRIRIRLNGVAALPADVRLLAMDTAGGSQQHVPLTPTGVPGAYETDLALPKAGGYRLLIESEDAGIRFGQTNAIPIVVEARP